MQKVKLWAYWDHAENYTSISVCENEPEYRSDLRFFHSRPFTIMQIDGPMGQNIFSTRVCPGLEPGKALEFEIEI